MTSLFRMEPLVPEDRKQVLEELATELVDRTGRLAGRVHPVLQDGLGDLVRTMNCYYSNLIEGHDTHPVDIDRALSGDYATDSTKRNLQLEARAHIEVQRMIDCGEAPSPVVSVEFILWVHREFCSRLPDELLWATNPDTGARLPVVPGELRRTQVMVGRHLAPEPDELPAFLDRFVAAYGGGMGRLRRIIAVAAAHHRLLWVHPFLDGNGAWRDYSPMRCCANSMSAPACGRSPAGWRVSRRPTKVPSRPRTRPVAAILTDGVI